MKNLNKVFLILTLLFVLIQTADSQLSRDWIVSYNPSSPNVQNANDIAADDDGFYYVLGSTSRGYNGTDVALVKYDPNGEFRWAKSYDGGNENSSDVGKSLITKKEGTNIYVYAACDISISGYGNQTGILKYDTSGSLIWNKIIPCGYNGRVLKITNDSSGFIYAGGGTSYEAFLIKLNSAGDTLWIKKPPLPANSTNCEIKDIVTDNSGNIYCTGKLTNPATNIDMFTCKYNSSGVLLWWKVYQYGFNVDEGNAIALSSGGILYSTGKIDPSNGGDDIVIIKYNIATGDSLWVKRYNGSANGYDDAKDIAVDDSDNVYVTGQTNGAISNGDLITLKYNSSGTLQWERKYTGITSGEDVGKELAIDSAGNVFVGGRINFGYGAQYVGIKYNSNGDSLWTRLYDTGTIEDVTGMVLDKNYNFVLTGNSDDDAEIATIKYNSSGQLQWMRKFYAAELIHDQVNSVVTDKNGNVYIAGKSRVSQYGDQFTVIKYNPAGVRVWIKSYGVQLYDNHDEAKAMVIDESGFIYVTGTSFSRFNNQSLDYLTFKLDTAGNQYWYKTYHGSGNGNDDAKAIAVDNSGNVYVTGESKSSTLTLDYCTIKYSSAGTELWVRTYNGPANGADYAYDIAVDNAGNVFVTGQSSGGATGDDIATIKYNSTGTQQWAQRYNGSGNGFDLATAIELDKGSNVYVCGTANFVANGNDAVLIKYGNDAGGTLRWVKNVNVNPAGIEGYFYMKLDTTKTRIHVWGQLYGDTVRGYSSYGTKYDSSGYRFWGVYLVYWMGSEAVSVGSFLDESENRYGLDLRTYPTGKKELVFNMTDSAGYGIYGNDFYSNEKGYGGVSNNIKDIMAVSNSGNCFIGYSNYDSTSGTHMSVVKYKNQTFRLDLSGFIQGFYNSTANTMIQDTVKAIVRNYYNPPYEIRDSATAIINSSGNATFLFPNNNLYDQANYYLVVKHRNSIETWSDTAARFTGGIASYNFTTAAGKAFGDNQIQVDTSPVRFAIYSGDVNQDGIIDGTDAALVDNDAFNFLSGYIVTDANGDEIIDGSDAAIVDNNAFNFVGKVTP